MSSICSMFTCACFINYALDIEISEQQTVPDISISVKQRFSIWNAQFKIAIESWVL